MSALTGNFFSKAEASVLSGLTRHQVDYLRRKGIVNPLERPVRYTWNQIILLKIISDLRIMFSLQELSEKVDNQWQYQMIFSDYEVMIILNEVGIVLGDFQKIESQLKINFQREGFVSYGKTALNINNKTVVTEYTLVLISNIIKQLFDTAKENNIRNFDKRVELASLSA